MGEVVGAGLLAHVPTMMLPPETRLELNEGKEISLVPALHQLREEVFETLDYDTVVVLDSHWFTTVEFVVTAQDRRAGLFTAEELPRGMCRIPYDWRGDPELARAMADAAPAHSTWVTANDDQYLPMYYATAQPLEVPRRGLDKRWISVSVAQTGDTRGLPAGRPRARRRDRRHRPQGPAARVRRPVAHLLEAAPAARPRGQRPRAHPHAGGLRRRPRADRVVQGRRARAGAGDDAASSCRYRPESMFAHYLMMTGALGEEDCIARARQYGDYENSIGTGQVHLWFDRPEGGFAAPRRTPGTPTTSARTAVPT